MTDPPDDRQQHDSPEPERPQAKGRHETDQERYDRNWVELLQEIRVTQMGTQIMTGFLLAAAFQDRMADLTTFQRTVYLVLVVLGVTTTALGLAPVSLHRTLFRRRMKRETVELGHQILRVVIAGVVLMLAGTAVLIFDIVLGTVPAIIVGAVVLLGATVFVILAHLLVHAGD
ncbi:DUF6328 family protein [Ornithinimicrobium faecis]|uniref:DUF6328 family protein n=1 Tax=Ornithinimicrobium faecis TaxID=2934158 RepID=A0ABY4YZV2_9MICO|nr:MULTISPECIES: DUF6328 family protein [unclassified Ornithinimicrobium]USQ81815.1 DUF6328 family protein [Ornithinimicrobium sp. HY1793]